MSLSLSLSIFFGHVMSSHHSEQIKGHKSLGWLLGGVLKMSLPLSFYLPLSIFLVMSCLLISDKSL